MLVADYGISYEHYCERYRLSYLLLKRPKTTSNNYSNQELVLDVFDNHRAELGLATEPTRRHKKCQFLMFLCNV